MTHRAALEDIWDLLDEALQADCEHGVRSLNEMAARNYLIEYPGTLSAIEAIHTIIRAELQFGVEE
jgi:hypothetical protein